MYTLTLLKVSSVIWMPSEHAIIHICLSVEQIHAQVPVYSTIYCVMYILHDDDDSFHLYYKI